VKAATFNRFGPTQVLNVIDMPTPKPSAGEVLVQVRAAAVNPKDTFIRKGRFRGFSGRRFPMGTGFDFAGEVADLGPGVDGLSIGDPVFGMLGGWRGGTCAEYLCVPSPHVGPKPDGLSFTEAAALPLVSLTALQALRDRGRIHPGASVCINGASGGVGSAAVQIATLLGGRVTGVSSADNHPLLSALGAERCVDYRANDIRAAGRRYDIFFDVFGNQPFDAVRPVLVDDGVWIATVIQPHVFLSMLKTCFFSRRKARMVTVKPVPQDLGLIRSWAEDGRLKPVIHGVYPLDEIQRAHAEQESKHAVGKIVVTI
jgi:NADPH:quinone reductase-like Zn-dependent oxidoreductase